MSYLKESGYGVALTHLFRALRITGIELEAGHDVAEIFRLWIDGAEQRTLFCSILYFQFYVVLSINLERHH